MGLTDALLLEAHPLDVWLAVRSDGVKGSGTENDPYDTTPRQEPSIEVTNLMTTPGLPREAVATTTAAHGYLDGDVVTIAGVTGPGAAQFNGSFPIYGKTATTFNYWMTAVPGGSAQGTGWTASRMVFPFDQLMQSLPENTAVHLGPGVFQTRGWRYLTYLIYWPMTANPNVGWEPKSGQKIVGSGMAVTTLKTVYAARRQFLHQAIGVYYGTSLEGFEASDFTVDCNLPGQPVGPPATGQPERARAQVACGAISVRGNHIRLRRIRAIRFGTQTVYVSDTDPGQECFVMGAGGAWYDGTPDPHDCVIEDCIVEQPSWNNTRETTCLIMGAREGELAQGETMSYHRGCVIRRCRVDCEYQDRPVPIASLTINTQTGIATATTRSPHGRSNGEWVVITGALENGSPNTTYNGSHEISVDPDYPARFTYTPLHDPGGGHPRPTVDATGDIWVGRYSSDFVVISHATCLETVEDQE